MRNMKIGPIVPHILSLTAPLLFSNILNQLYNTLDSVFAERYIGKIAYAAVGVSAPIMNIMTFLIVGITLGVSILIAEYFGAADYATMKREFTTSLAAGLLFAVLLTGAGIVFAEPILIATNTPDELMEPAILYLRIIFSGSVFLFLYNIFAAALRAVGDARTPLIILFLSAVLHAIFGILFAGELGWGIGGIALSTVVSQMICAVLCGIFIRLKVPLLRFRMRDLRIDATLLRRTIHYSWVSAVQQTFLYVGKLLVQGAVNPLGVDAIAAYNAVSRIDAFAQAPADSMALALTTFVSQNRGGHEWERIRKGFRNTLSIGIGYGIVLSVVVYAVPGSLISLFMSDNEPLVLKLGVRYLVWMSFFYVASPICQVYQGYFRGMGKMRITLNATVLQIPIRVLLTFLLVDRLGIQSVVIGIAAGWICMTGYEYLCYTRQESLARSSIR